MILEWEVDSDDPEEVKAQMGYFLNGVVQANRLIMLRERIPPLYKSGVRYALDPDSARVQRLPSCKRVLADRYADCKGLAAYLCAERRNAARSEEEAMLIDIDITWTDRDEDPLGVQLQPRNGVVRVFHANVIGADGRIENPSQRLRR